MTDKEYDAWRAKHDKKRDEPAAIADPPAPVEARPVDDDPIRSPLDNVFATGGAVEMDATPVDEEIGEERIIDIDAPDEAAIAAHEDAVAKRSDAVWYAVVGVAMLFMSGFHWGIAVGGVLMVIWGTLRYTYFSRLAKAAYDPWDDDDIDAWEEGEMASGERD